MTAERSVTAFPAMASLGVEMSVGTPVAVQMDGSVCPAREGNVCIGFVFDLFCSNCKEALSTHVEGKCLFASTTFIRNPYEFMLIQRFPKYLGSHIMRNGVPTVDVGQEGKYEHSVGH